MFLIGETYSAIPMNTAKLRFSRAKVAPSRLPIGSPIFSLRIVAILSTIMREGDFNPFSGEGATGIRGIVYLTKAARSLMFILSNNGARHDQPHKPDLS